MARTMIYRRITRASGVEKNTELILARMRAFAGNLSPRTPVTFLAVSTDEGLENYMVTPDSEIMNTAALSAAHAVAGKLSYVDELPDLSGASFIGHMRYRPGGARLSATQTGGDPYALAESLAEMPVGSWVAITMRAPYERMTRHETNSWDTWIKGQIRGETHHSRETNALIAHVAVGTTDAHRARSIMRTVAAGMHGFDLQFRVTPYPRPRTVVLGVVATVAALVVGVVVGALPGMVDALADVPYTGIASRIIMLCAVVPALATVAYVLWGRAQQRRYARGDFPSPLRRWALMPPAKPTQENDSGQTESIGKAMAGMQRGGKAGEYPLDECSFKLGPALVVGVLAPAAGVASGQSETGSRRVGSALTRPIGPLIGFDADGRRAHLSARDLWSGIAVFGKPGSGKSYLLRSLFAYLLMDQHPLPPGVAASPEQQRSVLGPEGAIVAFESKDGKDAAEYIHWARALDDGGVHVIDLADPEGNRIDMFDGGETIVETANRFVNKMIYHWGDQSIAAASRKTLRGVLTTGLAMPEHVWDEAIEQAGNAAPFPAPPFSPVAVAFALCGGYENSFALTLVERYRLYAKEVSSGVIEGDAETVGYGNAGLAELYGNGVKDAQRANLQKAPVSKLEELMLAPHWWVRGRGSTTFAQVLTRGAKVVINSGATSRASGASADGLRLAESTRDAISAMLLYSLRQAIEDVCGGWQDQGKYVAVISDEVSRVAMTSPDVIKWFRMQGRSYGVVPIFATQEPEQLLPDVQSAMFSLSTVMSYAQTNAGVSATIAEDFTGGATEGFEMVSAKEIMDLPKFVVMVRTDLDQKRQSVFTAKVEPFEDDRAGFRDRVYPPLDGPAQVEPAEQRRELAPPRRALTARPANRLAAPVSPAATDSPASSPADPDSQVLAPTRAQRAASQAPLRPLKRKGPR